MFDCNEPITPEQQTEIEVSLKYIIGEATAGIVKGWPLDRIAKELNIHVEFLELLPGTFPDLWQSSLAAARVAMEQETKAPEPVCSDDKDWTSMVGLALQKLKEGMASSDLKVAMKAAFCVMNYEMTRIRHGLGATFAPAFCSPLPHRGEGPGVRGMIWLTRQFTRELERRSI